MTQAGHGQDARTIAVVGSHNVRDLGGLPVGPGGEGGTVRTGRLYRSDYPAFVELDTTGVVERIGLRTVVDLRRGNEAAAECVAWADHGVAYLRAPITAGGEDSWHARYPAYLTHRPETVVAAVTRLMDAGSQPALFHCAAGKDRTGVVAALLLGVLGVADDVVLADYLATRASLEAVMERLLAIPLYAEMLADSSFAQQEPSAEGMGAFLAWLGAQGGAAAWLREHGVAASTLDGFRVAMTAL